MLRHLGSTKKRGDAPDIAEHTTAGIHSGLVYMSLVVVVLFSKLQGAVWRQ